MQTIIRVVIFVFASLATAQASVAQCVFDVTHYVGGDYLEDQDALLVWTTVVDESTCGGHSYAGEVSADTSNYEPISEPFEGDYGELYVEHPGEGAASIAADVSVLCEGFNGWVGPAHEEDVIQIPVACAIPRAFAEINGGPGVQEGFLDYEYTWLASTLGGPEDLQTCQIWENMSYSPYPFPNPPWSSGGSAGDRYLSHAMVGQMIDYAQPGTFSTTLSTATVYAQQRYYYKCTCYLSNTGVYLTGQLPITRSVFNSGGWKYRVEKQGMSINADNQISLP